MRIRVKKNTIVIEISEHSKYFNFVSSNLQNSYHSYWDGDTLVVPGKKNETNKKEFFLKTLYYMCVQHVQYQNPTFLKNLILSSHKQIELMVTDRAYEKQKCPYQKYYNLLNSNVKDPLHVIRKKYLNLAKIYHPDKVVNKNNLKEYTFKFQQIQEAYQALKCKVA